MAPIMKRLARLLLGDLDTSKVEKTAEKEAWELKGPADPLVVELIFEEQEKIIDESLESFRAIVRSFDGLMIFAGAMVAWLSKFIADLPHGTGVSRVLAGIAVLVAGISLCVCFLGRRAIRRPVRIGLRDSFKALAGTSKADSQVWLSRTMHVNRRKYSAVLNYVAYWLASASWLLCLAVLLAVLAVGFQR